ARRLPASAAAPAPGAAAAARTAAADGLEHVVEHEGGVDAVLDEVDFGTLEIAERDRIDDHAETVAVVEHAVGGVLLFGEGHAVVHAGATPAGDEDANRANVVVGIGDEPGQLAAGGRGNGEVVLRDAEGVVDGSDVCHVDQPRVTYNHVFYSKSSNASMFQQGCNPFPGVR